MFTVLTGNVAKNSNIFEITDNVIDDNSIIEVYPSDESIIPVEVSVTGSTLVVTFDSKAANIIPIKIFVNNLVGEYVPPSSGDAYDIDWKEMPESGMQSVGTGLDTLVDYFNVLEEEVYTKVPDDTVLGGVLYHSTTGNTWKKLNASNIDYDDNSTIYYAMGDIDELETESTNLVDAINEVNAKPSGGMAYSTTEFDTGKTWVDGRKIYGRVYNDLIASTPSGTIVTIASFISDLAFITHTDALFKTGGGDYVVSNQYELLNNNFDGLAIRYIGTYTRSISMVYIEYVKVV